MLDKRIVVPFDELDSADLYVDRIYAGKTSNGRSLDPLSKIFKVGVQGGIRFKGSAVKNSVQLVVLYSTGDEPDWRDRLDIQKGLLEYYGDNRHPGRALLETHLNGNVALRNAFLAGRGSPEDRSRVSPFFYFERVSKQGSLVRFRGLAAPGAAALTATEELEALWWSKEGQRFQNYFARFTILDAAVIPHKWIDSLLAGESSLSEGCPPVWREWVENRTYRPLLAPSTDLFRKVDAQLPSDPVGKDILNTVRRHFRDEQSFREFALAIWRFLAPATGGNTLSQGGKHRRRFGGEYFIGPPGDKISVGFVLEADAGEVGNPISDVSRLFSSLRHREFGVFVTLSVFGESVYREIATDRRKIALVCGRDVVETLRRQGFADVASVQAWLDSVFPVSVENLPA